MRIDRFLANNTELSRKQVKALLRENRIAIDGKVITDPATKLNDQDLVELDNEPVTQLGPGYFMLNKPEGVVCANTDADHPTVFDLLDEPHKNMHIAGRLDICLLYTSPSPRDS